MSIPAASDAGGIFRTGSVAQRLSLWARAEYLFLIFAGAGSLILLVLIPPLAGGNETYNFQRVATIATGQLLTAPSSVPGGVVKLLNVAGRQFPAGSKPPYKYSVSQFRDLATVSLGRDDPVVLNPNAIAVHNPMGYLPQVAGYLIGLSLGLSPLALFYLGRIFGAVAATGLTFLAIRRMPFHRYGLAALALLPTILFSRSTLDADQFTNAIAFFFIANVFAAIVDDKRLTSSTLATLVLSAFLIAQCKSAYFVLLLVALAIPAERYGSWLKWLLFSMLIILPGTALGIAWLMLMKHSYFTGIHYHTWAGNVYPDGQVAGILAKPLSYAQVILRTLFATNFFPGALLGFIGIFGPPVAMPVVFYAMLLTALVFILAGEGGGEVSRKPRAARGFALAAFVVGILLILTLLYVHWNALGAETVDGFQGRYFYPLAIPLLVWLPSSQPRPYFGLDASRWTGVLGTTALAGTVFVTWTTYWA